MYGNRGLAGAYRDTQIGSAQHLSPQRQLIMLLNGLIERVRRAEMLTREGDQPGKAKAIASAFPILEALRGSLDFEAGGELAVNLAALYDTASIRLAEANAYNDAAKLSAIATMLLPIAEAFAKLAPTNGDAAKMGTPHV